jgi:chromosome partitioning protein
MKTIVLHTPKGGSGKSTLACEIATMAARSGVSTALADLDPQGTTGGWYQRRQSADPALVDLGTRMLASAVRQLAAIRRVPPAQITLRADYPAAAIDGSAAADLTGKAAAESADPFRYIQTQIED